MSTYRGPGGPLELGPVIGRGGEGEVHALADGSGHALKVYARPDAAREAKVRSMVAARLHERCPGVAFPQALAFSADGRFAGFTMGLVAGCHPIHELYSPGSRRRLFPTADWRFLVRVATNLARVFARVHGVGAVVGDINGSGVLVSPRGTVSLIDADSFQWGAAHPCRVGVPEFTPPELQGRSLDGVERTVNHDGFGLAVMIFQILFLGRHPHAGVARGREVTLNEAIRQGRFAYSLIRDTGLSPPPAALRLGELPIGISTLFERAFGIGTGARPTPAEWIEELAFLESRLARCSTMPGRHHHASATGCPWCRLEGVTRSRIFGEPGQAGTVDTPPRPSPVRVVAQGTLRRAKAMAGESLMPARVRPPATPSAAAVRHERSGKARRTGLEAMLASSAGKRPEDPFSRRYLRARDAMNRELDAWRTRTGAWGAAAAAEQLSQLLRKLAKIESRHAVERADVVGAAISAHVELELRTAKLASAGIRGVGPGRLDALAKAGISAAADATRAKLGAVGAIGEAAIVSVLLWRGSVAARAARTCLVSSEAIADARRRIEARQRAELIDIERKLDREARALERLLDDVGTRARRRDPILDAALTEFEEASADLTHLDLPVPVGSGGVLAGNASAPAPARGPKTVGGKTTGKLKSKRNTSAARGCPLCGAPMVKRWARAGTSPNRYFLGCSRYPACTGSRPLRGNRP